LNYLCSGYKRFFTHCQAFVSEVASEWRRRTLEKQRAAEGAAAVRTVSQPGRNDPCPCGSGKKYKKCCLSLGH
jgi:uncharacterized protein YecA (UPF0149 family)